MDDVGSVDSDDESEDATFVGDRVADVEGAGVAVVTGGVVTAVELVLVDADELT